jgi:endoglucanase
MVALVAVATGGRPPVASGSAPALRPGARLARAIDGRAGTLVVVAHVRGCPVAVAIAVDGRSRGRVTVRGRRRHAYRVAGRLRAGRHRVTLRVGPRAGRCRSLVVLDGLRVERVADRTAQGPGAGGRAPQAGSPAAGNGNPFAGARFYVDPDSDAARTAAAWRAAGRTADAESLDKLARNSWAAWFGDWNGPDPAPDVRDLVARARAAGALPVLVAYDIPSRDCGGFSAGGAAGADAYRSWIDGFAGALTGPAAVVLEPDAVPKLDCLDAAGQASTLALLRYAVQALSARGAAVYVDAGNASWQPPAVIAARLAQAGIGAARGFSLNVSNFDTTGSELAYGHAISALVGGKPFVIDTSRNGQGPAPDGAWCNPPGRGLGQPATALTGDPAADAFLWVKSPGESDGACNGGPTAGVWWPDYALGLAQRAAFYY